MNWNVIAPWQDRYSVVLLCSLVLGWAVLATGGQSGIPPGFEPPSKDFIIDTGDLIIRDKGIDQALRVRLRLTRLGDIIGQDTSGNQIFHFKAEEGALWLGNDKDDGDIALVPRTADAHELGKESVHLNADQATAFLGGGGIPGQLVLRTANRVQTVVGDGGKADLFLGENGQAGDVFVQTAKGEPTITLEGANGRVRARQINVDGENPAINLHDSTSGNTQGWLIQAGSTGVLSFSAGNLNGLTGRRFVLQPDGGVCIGACQ